MESTTSLRAVIGLLVATQLCSLAGFCAEQAGNVLAQPRMTCDERSTDTGDALGCPERTKGPQDFTLDGDLDLIVWAPPFDCQPGSATGTIRLSLTPPERLFVFLPQTLKLASDSLMLCTIAWDGRDVLLRYRDGDVFIRSDRSGSWRLHSTVLHSAGAARKLRTTDADSRPYSAAVPYPIDGQTVEALAGLGVKEVTVGLRGGENEDKSDDVIDVSPLAGLPLESLILSFGGNGRPVVIGLDKIRGLEALAIRCFKNHPFPLGMVRDCGDIRYLNVFANKLHCDVDPRAFPKLAYCRIRVGKVSGISQFVEGVATPRLHLDALLGLAELSRDTKLSASVKHLKIQDSFDLTDISRIKASPALQELRIRGCKWLEPTDGFVRSQTRNPTESNSPRP